MPVVCRSCAAWVTRLGELVWSASDSDSVACASIKLSDTGANASRASSSRSAVRLAERAKRCSHSLIRSVVASIDRRVRCVMLKAKSQFEGAILLNLRHLSGRGLRGPTATALKKTSSEKRPRKKSIDRTLTRGRSNRTQARTHRFVVASPPKKHDEASYPHPC